MALGLKGTRTAVAALALAGLAACAGRQLESAPPPQLASKQPEIVRDARTGRERMHLSVLIYNVAGLPWPVRSGRPAAFREIARDLGRLHREGRAPDLLLLQETFTPEAERIGADAGYPHGAAGPRAGDRSTVQAPLERWFLRQRSVLKAENLRKIASSGLYIYSVYPLADVHMTPFGENTCAGTDCLANKGVMLVVVSIPGVPTPVQIMNTHLNARGASGVSNRRSLYAHNRQVDEIRMFLDRHLRPDWPFIYGGDFNTKKSRERYGHKVENIPGTVVRYHCAVMVSDCDVRMRWDGDAPWLKTQDLQGFASGAAVDVRPVRVEAMFDEPRDGRKLSDHDGYLVTYELSWPAKR